MAVIEIDESCVYPLHNHDAPEAHFVLEGKVICTWGEKEFRAVPGIAIQTSQGRLIVLSPLEIRNFGP